MKPEKTKPTRRKRWIRRIAFTTLGLLVVGAGVVVYLLQRPPQVWRDAQVVLEGVSPEAKNELSERIIHQLWLATEEGKGPGADRADGEVWANAVTARRTQDNVRGFTPELADKPLDQTFDISLTNDELVAVVRDSIKDWTRQRGYVLPEGMTEPVALVDNGEFAIVFEVTFGKWHQIFSGRMDLEFLPNGMAIGKVRDMHAGSLPMSLSRIGEMVVNNMPASEADSADRITQWIEKLEHFEFRPVLELKDRRRARVIDMAVDSRAVTLTMRVQDHITYKRQNELMHQGKLAVTDKVDARSWDGGTFTDVPATTD